MFESFLAVPFHFTIEFVGFVVATGAMFLVPSRSALVPGRLSGRWAAALGFALLAAASFAHGAAFIENDGNAALAGMRAAGLLALFFAVAGGSPVGGAAALFGARRPLLLAPSGAAILLALAALLRARDKRYRALLRLAAAAVLIAVAEALNAAASDARLGHSTTSGLAYAAHAARLVSHAVLATWLWAGVRSSVRSRFVASFAALLVVVVLALSTTLTGVIASNVEDEELRRIQTQLAGAMETINEEKRALSQIAQQIGSSDDVGRAAASGSNLDPFAEAFANNDAFPIDFVIFTSAEGKLRTSAGDGPAIERAGDFETTALKQNDVIAVLGSPVLFGSLVEEGRDVAAGIDKLDGSAAIVAGSAIPDPQNPSNRAGLVAVGRYLDAYTTDRISHAFEPTSATLFVDGRAVASDLPEPQERSLTVPADLQSIVDAGEASIAEEQTIANELLFTAFAPLQSDAGLIVLALSTDASIVATTQQDVTRSLFLVALGVGAVAMVLAWISGRRITRPIQSLTATARAVQEGDLDARAGVSGEDEVGQLGVTFNQMTQSLARLTDDLRAAAHQEQSLRARIETIIQSMADGLVAVDEQRRVLAFNMEAELLTGVSAEDAVGQPVEDVLQVSDDRNQKVRLPIHDLAEGAVANVYVMRSRGAPVPVAVTSAVLLDDNDEVAGGVAVVRDMTRERELEKLKGEFLANISHELRTPLTPIKGYAELLARSGIPAQKAQQFAKGILESTDRLERIVALLVDYAAIEAGRLAPRASIVDLGSLVERLGSEWKERSQRHVFEIEVNGGLPKVYGDERLLRRSLEEVIDNAVKFSPDGGTIRMQARTAESFSGRQVNVEVTVADEGIGISPEDLPRVFSDFQQLDGSETRPYGGLGLGLAFVQRIVHAHRGDVTVESEPERGTRLTITLPVVGSDNGER